MPCPKMMVSPKIKAFADAKKPLQQRKPKLTL